MQLRSLLQGGVCKLLLVNILSCGLEASMATVTVYIPPLLLQAGMEERYMTMVLAMGPVVGMIFIPIIGSASDSHCGRFGRRRPFIWMLSLGVMLGLQIMPQARRLAVLMSPQHHHWLEAALQAVAVCVIDFCSHACLTLLMALLSDLFPEEEVNKAFSANAMMMSLGGCLGFLLPAVDWRHTTIATYLGGQEAFVYALLSLIFLCCLFTTAFISEEPRNKGGGGGRPTVVRRPLKGWSSRYCPQLPLPKNFPVVLELCSWMALMSVMFFFGDFMGEALYQGVPRAQPESAERKQYNEGVRVGSMGLFLQFMVSVLCSMLMERWVALVGTRVVYLSSGALLVLATAVMSVSHSVITVIVMVAVTGYTLCVLHVLPYTLLCQYHSNKKVFFTSSNPRSCLLSESNDSAAPTVYSCGSTEEGTLSDEEFSDGSPHASLLVDGNEGDEAEGTPVSQRGMCYDMAMLENAYLISQVLPAMCLGSIVQLANSVRAYMASACCFSVLAFLCSTRVIYRDTDL